LRIPGIANSRHCQDSLQFSSIPSRRRRRIASDLDHRLDDLAIDAAVIMLNLGKLWMQEYSRIASAALCESAQLGE
jgi:hypothetical protein